MDEMELNLNDMEEVAGGRGGSRTKLPPKAGFAVYKIVSSIRGDSTKGRISTDSPLGKALSGHRAGETVTVRVNDVYSYECEIRKVVAVQDDGSDEIRQY